MTRRSERPTRGSRAAFTVVELLVVITIIAILIALVAGGGAALIGDRKRALTQNVLLALDRTLEEYMAANQNTIPPFIPAGYSRVPGDDVYAEDGALDAGVQPGDTELPDDAPEGFTEFQNRVFPRYPDAAVFIAQTRGYGEADAVLEGLGERWLVATPINTGASPDEDDPQETDVTPSIVDAWAPAPSSQEWEGGRPGGPSWPILEPGAGVIFYVHPDNILAEELYGRTVNRRPYFMSPGVDRLYGVTNQFPEAGELTAERNDSDDAVNDAIDALDDNIYSYSVGPANVVNPLENDSFSNEHR